MKNQLEIATHGRYIIMLHCLYSLVHQPPRYTPEPSLARIDLLPINLSTLLVLSFFPSFLSFLFLFFHFPPICRSFSWAHEVFLLLLRLLLPLATCVAFLPGGDFNAEKQLIGVKIRAPRNCKIPASADTRSLQQQRAHGRTNERTRCVWTAIKGNAMRYQLRARTFFQPFRDLFR